MKVLVINGPNLNLLGIREPELYGKKDYAALCAAVEEHARQLGITVDIFQSNCEGEIVTRIQQALGNEDAVVINAAAYTHTSIAILDALKAIALPAVEVHLTEPMQREEFRHVSYVGMACETRIAGFGFESYLKALDYLHKKYSK
ncbi:MAG: type II 3-dehydroquinate dehydratase [Clostridia bacterium]|nr:type II 3-dehydroquinate dehydratase [Clostridia bacterium]